MRSLFKSGNIPSLIENNYVVQLSFHTSDSARQDILNIIEKYRSLTLKLQEKNLVNLDGYPEEKGLTIENF